MCYRRAAGARGVVTGTLGPDSDSKLQPVDGWRGNLLGGPGDLGQPIVVRTAQYEAQAVEGQTLDQNKHHAWKLRRTMVSRLVERFVGLNLAVQRDTR